MMAIFVLCYVIILLVLLSHLLNLPPNDLYLSPKVQHKNIVICNSVLLKKIAVMVTFFGRPISRWKNGYIFNGTA
jgi:hypothetical protein